MSSIFVIIHQDEIRVIERTAKYEFEPVHIHCEPMYKIIDTNYTYIGNDLYNQLIDHLNVSNLSFCKLLCCITILKWKIYGPFYRHFVKFVSFNCLRLVIYFALLRHKRSCTEKLA